MDIKIFKQKIKRYNNLTLLAHLRVRLVQAGACPEAWAILDELARRYAGDDVGGMELPPPWVGWLIVGAILVVCVGIIWGVISLIW